MRYGLRDAVPIDLLADWRSVTMTNICGFQAPSASLSKRVSAIWIDERPLLDDGRNRSHAHFEGYCAERSYRSTESRLCTSQERAAWDPFRLLHVNVG